MSVEAQKLRDAIVAYRHEIDVDQVDPSKAYERYRARVREVQQLARGRR